MKKGIVDRFEGDYVVIEIDGNTQDVLKTEVDPSVDVNDVVIYKNSKWITDKDETKTRKAYMKKLMNSVWED